MKLKTLLKVLFIASGVLLFSNKIQAQDQFKVLLVTETAGWHHESLDDGIRAIYKLADRHSFKVVRQQDAVPLTYESLKDFDAIILLSTSADIFDNQEQAAFEKFIQSGKGFVGIHAASDTEYEWEWFTKLVGRMFVIHPVIQTAKINILNHNFPGLEHFPDKLLFTDEWYQFGGENVSGLNYLLTVDESTFNPNVTWKDRIINEDGSKSDLVGKGMGEFHPISWYHEFDGGRSFFTALGHLPLVYENSWFLEHLYGGIYYAATGKGIEKD